jgi:predicted DNA-binding transcriptional regulator AlpA
MTQDRIGAAPGLLSMRQVARRLGFTKAGVLKLIQRGEITPEHIDGFYIFREWDIERFIERRQGAGIDDGRYKLTR